MHLKFDEVKGYATYENARKRGEALESELKGICSFRWVVVALPSGRFAPMVIANDSVSPAWVIHNANCCIGN